MARRVSRVRGSKSKHQVVSKVPVEQLDYYEGLSVNQVKIVLRELDLDYEQFENWMVGQTCKAMERRDSNGKRVTVTGIYEYDLFRWIKNQKEGATLVWD